MTSLSDAMEFDRVIRVHADGRVTDGPADVYAPELVALSDADGQHLAETDNELQAQARAAGWDGLLTGHTSQYGYRGPCMHSSEDIGGHLARDILARPGLYVATMVGEESGEPSSWAVAYRLDPESITLDGPHGQQVWITPDARWDERVTFFLTHGNRCHDPARETRSEGWKRCAEQSAYAELEAELRGWSIEWRDDREVDHVREYPDAYDHEPITCEWARLVDANGSDLGPSLGCIDDASDAYRRVIAADLAWEALG